MITYEQALTRIYEISKPLGTERIAYAECAERVLAADIKARSASPMQDVSAMDGYGVHEADLASLPTRLPIVMESFAGSPPMPELKAGSCVRIFTGAPVPPGATRVVVQEIVAREGDIAIFEQQPGEGRNIRKAGGDFEAGDTLLEKGTSLSWRRMATAAAADRAQIDVYRVP